ncbi:thioredoxin family protein [Lysinibacillus xylanilyticus]|uniref:Thioredoxin family protein n=1 Tax=Lysinibacillus xylanilyticus TaxID=582475 RepID=A0ABT4ERI6_9BACI|nr:thioredoxin family protein [Lysinibacillus xylanilyticus]
MGLTQIEIRKLSKPNCRSCQVLGYALAEEMTELEALGATVVEHDITQEPELVDKYKITSIPVLIFERNSIEMARINGICNITEVFDAVKQARESR